MSDKTRRPRPRTERRRSDAILGLADTSLALDRQKNIPAARVTQPVETTAEMRVFLDRIAEADPQTFAARARAAGLDPRRVEILRDILDLSADRVPAVEDVDPFAQIEAKIDALPEPNLKRLGELVLELTPVGDVVDVAEGIQEAYDAFDKGDTVRGLTALAKIGGAGLRAGTGPAGKITAGFLTGAARSKLGRRAAATLQPIVLRLGYQWKMGSTLAKAGIQNWLPAPARAELAKALETNAGPVAKAAQDMILRGLKEGRSVNDALSMGVYSALASSIIETSRKSPVLTRMIAEGQSTLVTGQLDKVLYDTMGIAIVGQARKAVNEYLSDAFAKARSEQQERR